MQIDFTGRVVVVTGAGRGIGRTIAARFAAEGARVAALDVAFPEPPVPGCAALTCDVADESSVTETVAALVERFGRIDVLVNNAGINVRGTVAELDLAGWRRCFEVNVVGVFLMSRAVAAVMRDAGYGRILNAASFAAIVPSIGSAAYAASKAAVVQLTRVLAGELGPWGITVNAYAPGMVPTAMNGFAELEPEAQERMLDTLSLRRWGSPDDVADLVCFVASDRAAYITGTLLDVSGGKLATQVPTKAYDLPRP